MEYDTDNSKLVVPNYADEIPPSDAEYPNSTKNRRYNKNDHRHYLTVEGLDEYGVPYENDGKWLIRTASDHIYSAIAQLAQVKYNAQCYRLAKGMLNPVKTPVECYLEIERMLAKQARHIAINGDAKDTPRIVVSGETGRIREQGTTLDDLYWLHEEVQQWLYMNYLLDPNIVYNPWEIKFKEY